MTEISGGAPFLIVDSGHMLGAKHEYATSFKLYLYKLAPHRWEKCVLERMLLHEGVDGRVRLETPEKDVSETGPYTRTKISHQPGA